MDRMVSVNGAQLIGTVPTAIGVLTSLTYVRLPASFNASATVDELDTCSLTSMGFLVNDLSAVALPLSRETRTIL